MLCQTNWMRTIDDLLMELTPEQTYRDILKPNTSLDFITFLSSSECVLRQVLIYDWSKIFDERSIEMIGMSFYRQDIDW